MRLSRAMKPSDLGRSGSGAWWVVVHQIGAVGLLLWRFAMVDLMLWVEQQIGGGCVFIVGLLLLPWIFVGRCGGGVLKAWLLWLWQQVIFLYIYQTHTERLYIDFSFFLGKGKSTLIVLPLWFPHARIQEIEMHSLEFRQLGPVFFFFCSLKPTRLESLDFNQRKSRECSSILNAVTVRTIGLKIHGQNGLQLSYLDYLFIYLFVVVLITCRSNILMS